MPTHDSTEPTPTESSTRKTEVIEASKESSSDDTQTASQDTTTSSNEHSTVPHKTERVSGDNEEADQGHVSLKDRFWRNFDWIVMAIAATVVIVPLILWGEFAREYRNVWLLFTLLFAAAMVIKVIYCLVMKVAIELWLLLLPILFGLVSFILMELEIAVWFFTNLAGDDRRRRASVADWFFGLPMGFLNTIFIIVLVVLFGLWIYRSLKQRKADPQKTPHVAALGKIVVLVLLILVIVNTPIVAAIGGVVTAFWIFILGALSVLGTVMILTYLLKRQRLATFWSGFWAVVAAIMLLLPLGWSAVM